MFMQSRIQLNVKTEEHFMVVHSSLFAREREGGREREREIEKERKRLGEKERKKRLHFVLYKIVFWEWLKCLL